LNSDSEVAAKQDAKLLADPTDHSTAAIFDGRWMVTSNPAEALPSIGREMSQVRALLDAGSDARSRTPLDSIAHEAESMRASGTAEDVERIAQHWAELVDKDDAVAKAYSDMCAGGGDVTKTPYDDQADKRFEARIAKGLYLIHLQFLGKHRPLGWAVLGTIELAVVAGIGFMIPHAHPWAAVFGGLAGVGGVFAIGIGVLHAARLYSCVPCETRKGI
jgi:hypothetical protein